jgi:hypothetical protein
MATDSPGFNSETLEGLRLNSRLVNLFMLTNMTDTAPIASRSEPEPGWKPPAPGGHPPSRPRPGFCRELRVPPRHRPICHLAYIATAAVRVKCSRIMALWMPTRCRATVTPQRRDARGGINFVDPVHEYAAVLPTRSAVLRRERLGPFSTPNLNPMTEAANNTALT